MNKLIFGTVSFALVVIVLSSSAIAQCSGGSYSGASLSPSERMAITAQMAKNEAELAEINRHIANLDKAIAAAKAVDLVIGQFATLVPGKLGAPAYHAGKVIGYVAMGEGKAAGKSAITGIFGIMGNAPGLYGVVSQATSISIGANGAVSIGQEVGGAFGQ